MAVGELFCCRVLHEARYPWLRAAVRGCQPIETRYLVSAAEMVYMLANDCEADARRPSALREELVG